MASASQIRHASTPRKFLRKSDLIAKGPVAKRLEATDVWQQHKGRKTKPKIPGEKTRVNIVGEKLCGTRPGPPSANHRPARVARHLPS